MKTVAAIVVLLYADLFIGLTVPVILLAFYPEFDLHETGGAFAEPVYWGVLAVLLLCQAALLVVPVQLERQRPVSRRSVWLPIAVVGFLVGALVVGLIFTLAEFIQQGLKLSDAQGWSVVAGGAAIWGLWAVVFGLLSRRREPRAVLATQCRQLLYGSLLTFLVAVPTHIVARQRTYCCAGVYTFVGLTFGLAGLLISLGPGVYFLFAARWRKLHPPAAPPEPPA